LEFKFKSYKNVKHTTYYWNSSFVNIKFKYNYWKYHINNKLIFCIIEVYMICKELNSIVFGLISCFGEKRFYDMLVD